jgi:hypothetical protein
MEAFRILNILHDQAQYENTRRLLVTHMQLL